jgi:hypothetical protein
MSLADHAGDDLRALYVRAAGSPVMRGDHVDGARVIGFALTKDPAPADQMLVAGEEKLAVPPRRPVPCPVDPDVEIARTGPSPVQDLCPDDLHQPAASFAEAFEQQLATLGEGGDFIRALLDSIVGAQHLVWLVGGAVRDLLAEGTNARVADLDFTGTIGPGQLWKTASLRRGMGAGDYEQRISDRLVWSVAPPGKPGKRIIEYKPLSQSAFRFPAWGGDLACDAATRDLAINAVYYDHSRHVVADPTGRGLADLQNSPKIAFTPYRGDDPVEQACIILRCLKFRFRWHDLDMTEITAWAARLGEGLVAQIPAYRWKSLAGLRNRCIPEQHKGPDEFSAAAEIGPVAVRLIEKIHDQERADA